MSISTIISSDITNPIQGLPQDLSTLTARERTVLQAYNNEPWGSNENSNGRASFIETKCKVVDRDLLFQILMVEDVSTSKQAQLDELHVKLDPRSERVDRLRNGPTPNANTRGSNTPRGRRLVSQINMDSDNDDDDDSNNTNDRWRDNGNNYNAQPAKKATVYKFTIQDRAGNIFFAINSIPIPWGSCMLGSKIVVKKGSLFNRGTFLFAEPQALFLGGINRSWNEDRDLKMCEFLEASLERSRATNSNGLSDGTNTRSRKRKATNMD